MGQWLSAFSGPEIAGPLLFLSRHAPGWMRLGAGQSSVKLALLSRLGATSGAPKNQGLFLFGFHDYMMHGCPGNKLVNCDQCTPIGTRHFGFVEFVPASVRDKASIADMKLRIQITAWKRACQSSTSNTELSLSKVTVYSSGGSSAAMC
jgi:hypothetical protein